VSGPPVRVAAAVLVRGDGQVLLAQRPPGKAYAGYWEFPGGKLEAGETPAAALARELHEELGITVRRASPWLVQEFVYPHAHVELHFFRVFEWEGELVGHDGQAFAWQTPGRYTMAPLLPANTRILAALELPPLYAITQAEAMGEATFLARAERAFAAGLRLVQLRDKTLPMPRRRALAAALLPLAQRFGARVLWNGTAEEARAAACDGVHWTGATLAAAHGRPRDLVVAASCHSHADLARAGALDLDFAVLGPVAPTPTHPQASPLGWDGFRRCIAGTRLPVYALGGLRRADLRDAIDQGAHGVALMRGAWLPD
jgi:8-oxo-dGTP diphosphatase